MHNQFKRQNILTECADNYSQCANYSSLQGIYMDSEGDWVFPSTLPQLEVTNNYNLYFLDQNAQITSLSVYGATVIGVFILSLAIEMLHFIKWYMIVRKRITANCLMSLILDLHKNPDEVRDAQHKIRLSVCERITVTLVHFLAKALHLLIIYLILGTYNIGYIVISAAGMMMGNLVFGLIKDSIVINRVKREKKEIQAKKLQQEEVLKRRKSTIIFSGLNHQPTMDTERAALGTKE